MNCIYCNKEILGQGKKYCSQECFLIDFKEKNLYCGGKKKEKALCLYCQVPVKRFGSIYCSINCRALDWKEKGIHFGGPEKKEKTKIKKEKKIPKIKQKKEDQKCKYCEKRYHKRFKSTFCSSKCMGLYRRDNDQLKNWLYIAKNNTGPRNLSKETRLKMSLAATKRNASKEYTKGIGGIRDDIGHYVRSRWEANIARVLKYCKINYQYEPKYFILCKEDGTEITYTPDFKINSWFIEVKGWWDERSKLKIKLMKEQYPNIKIYIIDEKEYLFFEKEYKEKIKGWEEKIRR